MAYAPVKNRLAFFLVVVSALVRIFVPGGLLDLAWDYDTVSHGSIFIKIHPGTYMLALSALVLWRQRRQPGGEVYLEAAAVLGGLTALCSVFGILVGSTEAFGFLIDVEFAASLLCFCLSRLPETDRQATLPYVLGAMAVQCVIDFGEWLTHLRLVPYKFSNSSGETVFRPTGLLGHPLTNGLYIVTSIPFIMLLRLPLFVRYGMVGFFAAAVFAAETRFSTVVAIPVCILIYLMSTRDTSVSRTRETARFLQVVMGATLGPLVVVLGLAGGFGERLATGIVDQSSQARLSVYSILKYLTPHEMMTGVGVKRAAVILAVRQNLIIESPVVQLVFLVGAPMMVLFFLALGWSLFRMVRGSNLLVWLGLIGFGIVASSNNGLVTKTPELLFLIMLMAGARRRGTGEPLTQAAPVQHPSFNFARGRLGLSVAQRRAISEQRLQRRI